MNACAAAGIEPVIAMGREAHHPAAERALRRGAAAAARTHAARGDGASPEDARRQEALRLAQADARAGVRHHQVGAGVPPVPAARPRHVSAANGSLVTMAWNMKRMFVLAGAI